ncbi:MAG: hypothetical protein A3C07_04320 [Candidatus Sungbacteria bacterium RIFCSPHIGHO2_02_FULL_47_11]|uniref:GtrA/DPMS transmembrane domain-containing protein n=1 Tax=Candidatus Sungbacteria bacterium RIFCSPHIGHO2_02_FULL_47_11 TaxID=1802270 RepID=A0A1G2KQH0_9BACT|nr:MAG: hypothetical protein A3C07_04320 [Candidatus Sungbacteria bacterium RIFCSPHIGHO2_02_FULL_47_11]
MIHRIDYFIAALIGFLTGVFAIPVALNLGIRERVLLLLLPLAVPPVFAFGVWLGKVLSRWLAFMTHLTKFAVVGFLNFAIDVGILNLLSILTGIKAGFIIGGVNIPGFVLAAFNSYFWNKFWVFQDRGDRSVWHDFPKFISVTGAGLVINSVVVIVVTTYVDPFFSFSPDAWLNIAKVLAAIVSLGWNFVGYKLFVFTPTP